MTNEQINIAIAEACGEDNDSIFRGLIPDYCNNLNEMHEAEKVLLSGHWMRYCECLTYLLGKSVYASVHAKARDRAEAFLKTLGKWEEAK